MWLLVGHHPVWRFSKRKRNCRFARPKRRIVEYRSAFFEPIRWREPLLSQNGLPADKGELAFTSRLQLHASLAQQPRDSQRQAASLCPPVDSRPIAVERTPAQILASINEHGLTVSRALGRLHGLLAVDRR